MRNQYGLRVEQNKMTASHLGMELNSILALAFVCQTLDCPAGSCGLFVVLTKFMPCDDVKVIGRKT